MGRTSMTLSARRCTGASWLSVAPNVALGCAAASVTSSRSGSRGNPTSVRQESATGGAGPGAMQTGAQSNFGNAPNPTPTAGGAAQAAMGGALPDGCEVRKRCAPKQADGDSGSLTPNDAKALEDKLRQIATETVGRQEKQVRSRTHPPALASGRRFRPSLEPAALAEQGAWILGFPASFGLSGQTGPRGDPSPSRGVKYEERVGAQS